MKDIKWKRNQQDRHPYLNSRVNLVRSEGNSYSKLHKKWLEETEQCNDIIFLIFTKCFVSDLKGMISLDILFYHLTESVKLQ